MADIEITPADEQWQVVDWSIDLTGWAPGTPVDLPVGWRPLTGARRGNELAMLLMRQTV